MHSSWVSIVHITWGITYLICCLRSLRWNYRPPSIKLASMCILCTWCDYSGVYTYFVQVPTHLPKQLPFHGPYTLIASSKNTSCPGWWCSVVRTSAHAPESILCQGYIPGFGRFGPWPCVGHVGERRGDQSLCLSTSVFLSSPCAPTPQKKKKNSKNQWKKIASGED